MSQKCHDKSIVAIFVLCDQLYLLLDDLVFGRNIFHVEIYVKEGKNFKNIFHFFLFLYIYCAT